MQVQEITTLSDQPFASIANGRRFGALGFALALALVGVSACSSKPPVRVVVERDTSTTPSAGTQTTPEVVALRLRGPGAVPANAVLIAHTDGDTIRVRLNDSTEEKVRLIGIDTPETKRPGSPIQCFGPEASHFIQLLLPVDTPLALELDVEARDRYGRLLAYVRRAKDGLFINEQLALNGYAMLLTYPPNVAYTDTFRDAVMVARDSQLGLWGTCGDETRR